MKKTYPQIWDSYNRAQQRGKGDVQTLAHDLCAGVVDLEQARGRPRVALADFQGLLRDVMPARNVRFEGCVRTRIHLKAAVL